MNVATGINMLRLFMAWFSAQSPATRRAVVKERLTAYVEHPVVGDMLEACPSDVRVAIENAIAAIRRSDWSI